MIDEYFEKIRQDKMRRDEILIRALLCCWVSGLEPSLAVKNGEIIGLCDAAAEIGDRPFVLSLPT